MKIEKLLNAIKIILQTIVAIFIVFAILILFAKRIETWGLHGGIMRVGSTGFMWFITDMLHWGWFVIGGILTILYLARKN